MMGSQNFNAQHSSKFKLLLLDYSLFRAMKWEWISDIQHVVINFMQ